MFKFALILSLPLILPSIISCKTKGCADPQALNFDMADIDIGTCEFSRCVFYKSEETWNGFEITSVEIYGNYPNELPELLTGQLNWTYPSGNLNCSSPGVINCEFRSGDTYEWNATIYTTDPDFIYGSNGVIQPSPYDDCLKVDVTR